MEPLYNGTFQSAGPTVARIGRTTMHIGLVTMAAHLLKAEDKTGALAARGLRAFVLYGEDDNAWPTAEQRAMAGRLNAERTCIPAAAHNPNVEAPATTAHALTTSWNAAER